MGKSGLKSTELWFNAIAFVVGAVLTATGAEGGVAQIIGGVMMALAPTSYAAGRASLKGKEAIGASQVEAAKELAKKPSPEG